MERNIHYPPARRRLGTSWFFRLFQSPFVVIFTLVAGCVLAQPSSAQQDSDTTHTSVRGTVVNSVTHDPIGRALVHSSDNRFAALTDGEGHFEFAMPANGASSLSWLMARRPGFLDDYGERRRIEVIPGSDVIISLTPEAVIRGRAMLSASEPAAGVNIQLLANQVEDGMPRWIQHGATRANSNGEFSFAELQAGAYKLVTRELMDNDPAVDVPGGQAYGFPPVFYPNAADFGTASTIQLTAGEIFQADLTLVRQAYYPVKIPVTNPDLKGGINVSVSPQGHPGPGFSLGYNAQKHNIEGALPNGNYRLEASSFGENPATGTVNLVVAGGPAAGPAMVMTPNGSINLNVTEQFSPADPQANVSWSDGQHTYSMHGPRTYLQVSVEPVDDFEPQRGGSLRDPSGPNDDSLALENIAPGRYWLRITSTRGYVAAASMGGVDLLHQPLVVGSGATTPIEIRMRDDMAEIDGTVAGVTSPGAGQGSSSPRPSSTPAYVYCVPLPDSPGEFRQLSAANDGTFASQAMAPGSYRVLAFKNRQPRLPYRDPEAMRPYETKGQVVHVTGGQKASVELSIVSGDE